MREICLINKGENIDKIKYRLSLTTIMNYEEYDMDNMKYFLIEDGSDDIVVVRNYNPFYLGNYNTSIEDLYLNGFTLVGNQEDGGIIYRLPSGIKYNVKPLETIEDIANKFNVTVDYIMEINNLNTNKLFVGQVLLI